MFDPRALPAIYFIRHGETAWNAKRKLQGHTDIHLNNTGRKQATAIARCLQETVSDLSKFDLRVSPLARARETMDILLRQYELPLETATIDPRLIERSFGIYEGITWEELNAQGIGPENDAQAYYHWQPRQGESNAEVEARLRCWLGEVTVPQIIVSHGAVSRVLRGLIFELPKAEIPFLRVPQDRFYCIRQGKIEWFDARHQVL